MEDDFSPDRNVRGGWFQDDSSTSHYFTLDFYHYYICDISYTSHHQALDFGGCGPLFSGLSPDLLNQSLQGEGENH